ncbi:MAG TPA: hypothetical protein VN726_07195 [Hanamia sp.]|nr:hypothetical protein [Hanamia sp.]
MAKLTAQQANILANNFLGLAQAIGDYRYENWATLSKGDNQKLGTLQRAILNYGEDVLALSTVLVMNDVADSLNRVNDITAQIKSTIQKLKNIQKVINVATAIVSFGAAIISKDPQTISTTLDSVFDAWKQKA